MMPTPLQYILTTYVSKRDVNGNCYNWTTIRSTKTGYSLQVFSGWGSSGGNIRAFMRDRLDWGEFDYKDITLPIREWNRCKPDNAIHEHELTWEHIESLNNEGVE